MFCDWAQPSKLKAAVHHSGPLAVFTTLSASQIKRAKECCWRHLAALWKADKYSLTFFFFLRGLFSQITCLLWRRIWKVASSWTLEFQSEASMLQISGCFHTYSSCIIYSSLNQRSLVSWHRGKKTSKPKYVTTNHMRRLFGQIQETQEQVAVFSTGGELETPFIFIWKNILHVCGLPHSQNTKSMPGYRKTFSSHLKYSPQIML